MSADHLLREHAPISAAGWALIDEEARQRLVAALAARRLVDFTGPHGWEHSATNLGRVEPIGSAPCAGVDAWQRRVLAAGRAARAVLRVSRDELRAGDRGAEDVDLDALDAAARNMAVAENKAVFHGWSEAGIRASPRPPRTRGLARRRLQRLPAPGRQGGRAAAGSGVAGPYGLALGTEDYTGVTETAEHGGYPLFDHLRKILGGPIVWSPGVEGAVVRQPARRRLPLRLRPGPRRRLRAPRRRRRPPLHRAVASPSASPPPRPPSPSSRPDPRRLAILGAPRGCSSVG